MFVQLFASLLQLSNLINSGTTSSPSFKRYEIETYSDIERTQLIDTPSTQVPFESLSGTYIEFDWLRFDNIYNSGALNTQYYALKFTIYSDVTSNSGVPCAYLRAWINNDGTQNGHLSFVFDIESAGSNYSYFNLRSLVNWHFTGGVNDISRSYEIDFTSSSYVQRYVYDFGSRYTMYDILQYEVYFDINFSAVSEQEYTNVVYPQESYNDGYNDGYQEGYTDGLKNGGEYDSTALVIFTGICNIGLLPVNFFLAILNFEVFGINIGAFVSALLTVAIVIIITRMIFGGANKGSSND